MDQGEDGDMDATNADYSIRVAAGMGAFTLQGQKYLLDRVTHRTVS